MKTVYVSFTVAVKQDFCLVVKDHDDLTAQIEQHKQKLATAQFEYKPLKTDKKTKLPILYQMNVDWPPYP